MKIHRFYIPQIHIKDNSIVLDEKNFLNQILNVFRFKVGAAFIIFDGTGTEFYVKLIEISKKRVVVEILEEKMGIKRNKKLSLIFSMIKKENVELVLQKCTEIGVTNFVPVLSERTVKTGWNQERAEKIINEAVEQSGWSDIPHVNEPEKLVKILDKLKSDRENLDGLCVLDFDGTPLSSVKHLISVDTVLVGPEGGWSGKEREMFKKYNVKNISLGNNVLRAETACISVASIFLL